MKLKIFAVLCFCAVVLWLVPGASAQNRSLAERLGYPVQKLNFINQDENIRGGATAEAP